MRKAQKQDIMDMLQTLHEAHEEIRNNIDRKNYILAQDLLSQCQEGAISIGTAIETFEGEGFVTVGYIETYCDVVFSCHEELNGSDANANKLYKNLKKQLLRVESSVKNDIPVRKEVVFFPYKASMWDSLESVYLAAKEDPDCDAYCVPIPYYDRNPDRSLGQMHYEGREYPKNIEVIDWQTYNFEERKPDAIYIHNPYDDWNLVTCVHPRYFSNNLKKYTDKLVYIPYFVLDEIEPDDQARIDAMKHFIWTPGVINADKVIVQSEKMKQIYVNEYLKAAQANGLQGKHLGRNYLEEKFLGLGSPKFDKVQNTKKEDLEIPEDWLRIIEKPDGSWKKIIFYNTSIAALLENNEKMLEKMKDVFRIFKENKDEVALLWRPHPLIKTTVSAMRPQLWMEYEKLVNQYKEEGWGMYDDTSDMDRAVVLSDAYYGDQSSVVKVYQQVRKPMMIQKVNCIKRQNNKNYIVSSNSAVIHNEKMYLVSEYVNALLEIDMSNDNQIHLFRFPQESNTELLFWSCELIEDKIWFAPFNAKEVWVFDCNNKEFSNINGVMLDNEKAKEGKFLKIIHYGKFVYLIGESIRSIIKIDIDTKKVVRLNNFFEKFEQYKIEPNSYYELPTKEKVLINNYAFAENCLVNNDKLYLPLRYINYVLTLNLVNDEFSIIHIDCKDNKGFSHICVEDTNIILSGTNDNRINYNYVNNIINEIYNNFISGEVKIYHNIIQTNDKDIYFCATEEILGIRAKHSNEIEKIELTVEDEFWNIKGTYNSFGFEIADNKDVMFQTRADAKIYRLNTDNLALKEINIDVPQNYYNEIVKEKITEYKYPIQESGFIALNNYLSSILGEEE